MHDPCFDLVRFIGLFDTRLYLDGLLTNAFQLDMIALLNALQVHHTLQVNAPDVLIAAKTNQIRHGLVLVELVVVVTVLGNDPLLSA
ncbi:hypothetical protein D3C76_1694220 [compost metagenome]